VSHLDKQERQARLSPAQQALFRLWKRGESSTGNNNRHITPRAEDGPVALSFSQQRLWFLDRLEPGNPFYTISVAFRLSGSLRVDLLRESLNRVVQRHESLRTAFTIADEQPLQYVLPLTHCPFQEQTLAIPPGPGELQEQLRTEARTPFNLQEGPLLRARVLHLNAQEHILQISMHHIISDGGSMDIFLADLAAYYNALLVAKKPQLPSLSVHYADYAVWQRAELTTEKLAPHLEYWKQRLNGIPPLLDLPTDYPRQAIQRYQGSLLEIRLPASLTATLRTFCQREGVTPFAALLATFQAFLARYTGQKDIVIGTDITDREHAETEAVIGFFVNTLLVRTHVTYEQTFRELLRQVRQQLLEDIAHHQVPFDTLVAELQPERTLSHSALFQVMFSLQNTRIDSTTLTGLQLERLVVDSHISRFDLLFDLFDTGEQISGVIEYNTDLFKAETISRIFNYWLTLLTSALAQPEQRIAQLPLLSDAERRRMLIEWNTTSPRIAYPEHCDLAALFTAQVNRTPDSIAAICEEEQITYACLKQRVDQLTALLQQHQIGPESVVGICLDRSILMLVSLLAIFQAGAAYVPLEPDHPRERLHLLLEETAVSLLLTTRAHLQCMEPGRRQAICVEELSHQQATGQPEPIQPQPEQLAYVIFTSGSTGRPKGAMLTYDGMLNHLYAKIDILQLGERDRVAQSASLSFDISLWQFLSPLLVGGTVCILDSATMYTPSQLYQSLHRFNISVLELVPAQIRMLLEERQQRAVSDTVPLRWLISTGEAIPPQLCRHWLERYPNVSLINTYGATECSDDVTHEIIAKLPDEQSSNVAVGHLIPAMQIYILDDALEPVPVGVPGHIYIGGQGVGRGYLHNPARTAETYLPDPFSAQPGARFYKTGDVGRYWPDGRIECLGRIDNQVKVHGHRVELGEIETVLMRHEQVAEAVAIVREDAADRHIVAYVVPREASLSTQVLRTFLQQKLPEYMLPAHFVLLERFPLNANGKIDKHALPAPSATFTGESYVAPKSPAEELIAALWADLLSLERVGLHDNFFVLGGHSLLATQTLFRIRSIFEVELPLRSLFERPTVAGIVDELAQLYEDRATVDEIARIYQEIASLPDEELP